jgi:signal transduction histidine kinase
MGNTGPLSLDYVKQLEILLQVDEELSLILDTNHALAIGLDAAVRLGNAESGAIHLIDNDRLRVAQVIGAYPKGFLNSYMAIDLGLVGRAIQNQHAELVLDVLADPDYVQLVPEMRAQMTIPLTSHNRPIGSLNIQTATPKAFTEDVFKFVQLLAARISIAVDNARLYEQLKTWLTELRDLYDKVSELEKVKSDMIRMAAHDLRNPLHNINVAFDLLAADMPESIAQEKHDLFAVIRQSINRMRTITTDILSLERIENTVKAGIREVVSLRETAQQVYHEHELMASQKKLVFRLEDGADSLNVYGSQSHLYEVIANLVTNALKYTPEGGQVEIKAFTDAGNAVIEVCDTGFGVPENALDKLFQPFSRVKTEETIHLEGTGLGLYMVKRIVERHGGHLRFSSVYGKGSTFGFELPLAT